MNILDAQDSTLRWSTRLSHYTVIGCPGSGRTKNEEGFGDECQRIGVAGEGEPGVSGLHQLPQGYPALQKARAI
jgi:hypothetical protein